MLLGITVVLALWHTLHTKKQIAKLGRIEDFNERASRHIEVYRIRLYWYIGSCLFSCVLYLLTTRTIFLYFALFDLASALPYYPNKVMLKRELGNEDIVLH